MAWLQTSTKGKPMKRLSCLKLAGILVVACAAVAAPATDGNRPSSPREEQDAERFSGTLKAVDAGQRRIEVMNFWTTRSFSLTDQCEVRVEDHEAAGLGDLLPGHRVQVVYRNVAGVRIASEVAQRDLQYEGEVAAVDTAEKTLRVRRGWRAREFRVPEKGVIVFSDGTRHPLGDLKTGQRVKVRYCTPEEVHLALKIEQLQLEFTGRIDVLDADRQLINAGNLVANHTFQLSDDCKFVLPGSGAGTIEDLQIGDRVTFVYEDIEGVPVASKVILEAAGQASHDPAHSSRAAVAQR